MYNIVTLIIVDVGVLDVFNALESTAQALLEGVFVRGGQKRKWWSADMLIYHIVTEIAPEIDQGVVADAVILGEAWSAVNMLHFLSHWRGCDR